MPGPFLAGKPRTEPVPTSRPSTADRDTQAEGRLGIVVADDGPEDRGDFLPGAEKRVVAVDK
jgi:hypothetical protein